MSRKIRVEVTSDLLCPWCWVGKRSIEAAAKASGVELELHWLPFQLDPTLPAGGVDKMQHYIRKFGPQARQMLVDPNSGLKLRGRELGVEFRYHEGSRVFNSLAGHRLAFWTAQKHGLAKQNALMEVFFRRYFDEGRNLGTESELVEAAAEVGLDKGEVAAFLRTDEATEEVGEELTEAHAKCNGVPHFVFPSGRVISGGESVATFGKILTTEK